ncbi:MAG TPA: hypothetical protein P5274_02820 [Candidatus Paceibacterota bacterium]|nr:hypothetical protein [Candidatus Paceibacterota bacterium]
MSKHLLIFIFPFVLLSLFTLTTISSPLLGLALETNPDESSYQPPDPTKDEGLVTCGRGDAGPLDCNFANLLKLIDDVLLFFMYVVIFPIAIILIIYAGGMMAWYSHSQPGKVTEAKNMLRDVLIGFGIIFGSALFVQQVFSSLANTEGGALTDALNVVFFKGDR